MFANMLNIFNMLVNLVQTLFFLLVKFIKTNCAI